MKGVFGRIRSRGDGIAWPFDIGNGVRGVPAEDERVPRKASKPSIKNEFTAFKTNRIVEVASHLFYERGYSSCTLDHVAERLGVTKPFLYSYFKNKEAILAAICEVGISESLSVLERTLAGEHADHRALLAEVVRQVGRIVIDRQEYVVVYQREMKHLSAKDHDTHPAAAAFVRPSDRRAHSRRCGSGRIPRGYRPSWPFDRRLDQLDPPGIRRKKSAADVIDQLVDAAMRPAGAE